MKTRTNAMLLLCAAIVLPLASGCDDDELEPHFPSSPLVGTWIARNIETPEGDAVVDEGMSLIATIGDAGTVSFNVTGDVLGLCDPGPDCNFAATWASTDNTITIDSGDGNTTVTYSVQGDTMTWIGTIEGVQTAIIYNRIL